MVDLETRLAELELAWASKGMPHMSWLRPGLRPDEVKSQLASAGLETPGELAIWFCWHDGAERQPVHGVDPKRASFRPMLALSDALATRTLRLEWAASERAVGFPEDEDDWGPLWGETWLPLLEPPTTIFADLRSGSHEVRVVSNDVGGPAEDAVSLPSLADLIGLWITIINDHCEWDAAICGWRYEFAELPNDGVTRFFV